MFKLKGIAVLVLLLAKLTAFAQYQESFYKVYLDYYDASRYSRPFFVLPLPDSSYIIPTQHWGANSHSIYISKYNAALESIDINVIPQPIGLACENEAANSLKILKDATIFGNISFWPCNLNSSFVWSAPDSILLNTVNDSVFTDIESLNDSSWALIQELPEPHIFTLTLAGDTLWNLPLATVFGDTLSGNKKVFVLDNTIVVVKQLPLQLVAAKLDFNGVLQSIEIINRQNFSLSDVYYDNNHLIVLIPEMVWVYDSDLTLKHALDSSNIGNEYWFTKVKIDNFNRLYISTSTAHLSDYNEYFKSSQFTLLYTNNIVVENQKYYWQNFTFDAKILAMDTSGLLFSCEVGEGWGKHYAIMKTGQDGFYKRFCYSPEAETSIDKEYARKSIENELIIFPNPAQDHITVQSTNLIQRLEIQNLSGQIVYREEGVNTTDVQLYAPFPKGIYAVLVTTKQGTEATKLIVGQ